MSKNHKPDELLQFLNDLERLAAGLMICRADVNERIRRYGEVLKAIQACKDLFDEVSPLELSLKERNTIIERLDGDLYLEPQFRLYVLYRLNDAYSDESGKFRGGFEFPRITIEHVLPQTLPKGGEWERLFPPFLHEKYLHKLGNLALLTRRKGAQASFHEFEEKKKDYATEKFGFASSSLIMQVMNEKSWTPEVIDKLQAKRLDKLREIWRL
jgi:hypothetical protein